MSHLSIEPAGCDAPADLALLGNRALQVAIRRNLACFPSQAPIFGKKPRRDVQWRLAVLYFIRGWSTRRIAKRYGLTRERCGQIISDWRVRAVNMGYIQDITPDEFDLLSFATMTPEFERDQFPSVGNGLGGGPAEAAHFAAGK